MFCFLLYCCWLSYVLLHMKGWLEVGVVCDGINREELLPHTSWLVHTLAPVPILAVFMICRTFLRFCAGVNKI